LPLGGWAGRICEVHKHRMYTVRWSRETLRSIHPIYKRRCDLRGLDVTLYDLREDDLEPDPGGPVAIEQPGTITPRPLSQADQGDRVRMVFGLTSDDPLPAVDEQSLEVYHGYLGRRLSLPAEARYYEDRGNLYEPPSRYRAEILALGKGAFDLDEEEGILCEIRTVEGERTVPLADMEVLRSDPNHQLVDDYSSWFSGELFEDDLEEDWEEDLDEGPEQDFEEELDDDSPDEDEEDEEPSRAVEVEGWAGLAGAVLSVLILGAGYGAVVVAALSTMPGTKWGALVGGSLLGIFTAGMHAKSAAQDLWFIVPRLRTVFGGATGFVSGAALGAMFGIMVVAFAGAILGGIMGWLLQRFEMLLKTSILQNYPGGVLIGAACGVAAQAFYLHPGDATRGLWLGALLGIGGALCYFVAALVGYFSVTTPDYRRMNSLGSPD